MILPHTLLNSVDRVLAVKDSFQLQWENKSLTEGNAELYLSSVS